MRGIALFSKEARQLFSFAFLLAVLVAACGDRTPLDVDLLGATGDDAGADGGTLPPGCGDGVCKSNESCSTCSVDCGFCAGCGDKQCNNGELCSSCPQDCGVCPETCGDGFCKGNETCLTCAPDCGNCPGCGDKKCDPKREDCFTCPDDCGKCMGCGDGLCKTPETCASCAHDCGVCAVCGNQKCEPPYETCTNCEPDCGMCTTIGCLEMLTCATRCIDGGTMPPTVRVSCVGDCVSRGCPSAQFFFDQAFNCFIQHINECGANFGCLQMKCDPEVAACIGSHCPQ